VERIAFVGLGTMGAAMAANLCRAGFPLTAWNRTPGRAGDLVALGAAGRAIPGRDLEAGAAQVGGHRRPHGAEPHERDALHAILQLQEP
jgi:6-phosphogluconate dehydrogenase